MLSGAHSVNSFAGEEVVCAIDLGNGMYNGNRLETGFNYRLLGEFAEANHCNIKVVTAYKNDNYADSLQLGKIDILITDDLDITGAQRLCDLSDHSAWMISPSDPQKLRQINNWISHIKTTSEYDRIKDAYSSTVNPFKAAENGLTVSRISPYDDLIRKHAKTLEWDWRMVAAIIYQESRFSICSASAQGAQGLMQVMPRTGANYGISNLLDPEQNIMAGTRHLHNLQEIFSKYGLEDDELVKFTLAAYNAGRARIVDCRNLAESRGYDKDRWEEVVKVIPLMREDNILKEESVKYGKFQGDETIKYVDNVMATYNAICRIHPTSF